MNTTQRHKTILVIGATGGIGHAVAQAFLQAGWQVRALSRRDSPQTMPLPRLELMQWVKGDALNAADVIRASQAVDCICHAANPPKYQKWRELALPMLANSIEAARVSGARLLFPGNVYNFGPDAWPLISESSPQHPHTKKGAVRVEMEGMLEAASQQGVRSIVVRAGDFFGGHGPSSWFSNTMLRPGKPVRSMVYMGDTKTGHAWAYMPDLAQTFLQLALKEKQLSPFEVFHFSGHWLSGDAMIEAIKRVTQQPALRVNSMPWLLVKVLSPFVGLMREIQEMRYLWQVPVQLSNQKLLALLGEEPHTDLDTAIRHSLVDMKCLTQ
jgi:nucleoside-diphosphate-sugar epimerase